jgi:hypothetical protein
MTTQIRCPRCKAETDSSTAKPGSVIKCVHCRGDMRVPDAPKAGGPGVKGGRQSTLFRKMTNASVPGQRGRGPSMPSGSARPGADAPKDMSGVYKGIGIAGAIAAVIVIGILMKGKSPEPEKPRPPRKSFADAPAPPPPLQPPAPPVDTMAEIQKKGAPPTFEQGADKYVHYSIKPITPSDPAAEKDAMTFIKAVNMKYILATPFRYLPYVINSMISDDQAVAVASFQVLHAFCEEHKLYVDGKNWINLGLINSPEYRGHAYQEWVTRFWPERSNKLPDSPGNKEAVERVDWVGLARSLQGGAYHTDENQGIAYRKVKSYGKSAWPKLVALIDHEELPVARSAGQLLNDLTGEKKPLPTEQNRTELRNAWAAWVENNK